MAPFNTSLRGYNKLEVDNFLKEITNEYESLLNKLKQQDKLIEELQLEQANIKALEKTLNRTMILAQDTAKEIKKVAKEEARKILEEARICATKIVNDNE